jgi:hypothetical protein
MASKQQRAEVAKKRDKRSKIALLALGVVLLGVGAFEIPSMLKVMNKKPPAGSTYDPGPSSSVPGSLPNVAVGTTGTTAAPAAPSGQLVNTDIPPASGAGQLVTFEVFQTKNPFAPQVSSAPTPADTSGPVTTDPTATTPATTTPTTTTPTSTTPGSAVPPSGAPTTTSPTTTTPAPAPLVTISVNGATSRVGVDGTFPSGSPVFRLVSYTSKAAEIGIVGGSYAAGGATLTLELGRPVTLQNTTDGKQYKLELLKTP